MLGLCRNFVGILSDMLGSCRDYVGIMLGLCRIHVGAQNLAIFSMSGSCWDCVGQPPNMSGLCWDGVGRRWDCVGVSSNKNFKNIYDVGMLLELCRIHVGKKNT